MKKRKRIVKRTAKENNLESGRKALLHMETLGILSQSYEIDLLQTLYAGVGDNHH